MQLGEDFNLHDFKGTAIFSRTPQGLFLQADFKGNYPLECVRCLDLTDHLLIMEFSELFAFDNRSVSESGLLVPESGYIDLEPLIREYAILDIPISPLCKTDCRGLCLECGQNLNQYECGHFHADASSPFSSIKSLIERRPE